jgi:hypothetical protein
MIEDEENQEIPRIFNDLDPVFQSPIPEYRHMSGSA